MGLYQCVAAVPRVFDVTVPEGLEHYTDWLSVLEFPVDLGLDVAIPSQCFGSYSSRLWLGSCWPIAILFAFALCILGWKLAQQHHNPGATQKATDVLRAAFQESLPLALWLTFVLVPSTAARIFETFLCSPFEYDFAASETRRYLHRDLSLSCDGSEYQATKSVAIVFCIVWPIGASSLLGLKPELLCAQPPIRFRLWTAHIPAAIGPSALHRAALVKPLLVSL